MSILRVLMMAWLPTFDSMTRTSSDVFHLHLSPNTIHITTNLCIIHALASLPPRNNGSSREMSQRRLEGQFATAFGNRVNKTREFPNRAHVTGAKSGRVLGNGKVYQVASTATITTTRKIEAEFKPLLSHYAQGNTVKPRASFGISRYLGVSGSSSLLLFRHPPSRRGQRWATRRNAAEVDMSTPPPSTGSALSLSGLSFLCYLYLYWNAPAMVGPDHRWRDRIRSIFTPNLTDVYLS
ncbi:hypothetical protein B0H11DRAFT_2186436 [Mycena galericulata]|nr:hypothetical protein B0H11DRAFT_2186436 [Mycena galericulata]